MDMLLLWSGMGMPSGRLIGQRGNIGNVGTGDDGTKIAFGFGGGAPEEEAMPRSKVKYESYGAVLPAEVALSCVKWRMQICRRVFLLALHFALSVQQ